MTDRIFWALLAVSGIIWLVPRLFVLHNRELSGEELIKINQCFTWIGKRYPFLLTLWCLFIASIYTLIGMWLKGKVGDRVYLFVAAWSVSISVLDGLIVVCTGVYPMPSTGHYSYIYEGGIGIRRVGLIQALMALAVTAASFILVLAASS